MSRDGRDLVGTSALSELRFALAASRRQFLGALALVMARPRLALGAEEDDGDVAVIRAVCDRLVPKHGDHPGADALGIHERAIEYFRRSESHSQALDFLAAELRKQRFAELEPAAQDAILARHLAPDDDSRTARILTVLRNATVVFYFATEAAWPPIRYKTPQPLGYPDYATCPAPRAPAEGTDAARS